MIRSTLKVFTSRYACTLSAAALAALLSACSPTSPTTVANPAAGKPAPARAAPAADPNSDLPEIVITASRIYGAPASSEARSARVRSHLKDKSS